MLTNLLNPLFGIADDRGIYIFGLEIYYYAFCIVGAMIAAALLSALLMKRRNMSTDFVFTIFLVCIPTAIISARLFSVLTDGSGIQNFFAFRDGGLSITGGVIGGVLAGLLVCKIRKMEFLRVADCIVLNILFAMVSLCRARQFQSGFARDRIVFRSECRLALRIFLLRGVHQPARLGDFIYVYLVSEEKTQRYPHFFDLCMVRRGAHDHGTAARSFVYSERARRALVVRVRRFDLVWRTCGDLDFAARQSL